MPDRQIKPFTASKLSQTWLKLTGRDKWERVEGLVFSSEHVPRQRNALGHYYVTYSYKVNEERFVGRLDDFASVQRFRNGDRIPLRVNPTNPNQSYYPDQLTDIKFFLVMIATGASIGVVVILANWWSK